MSKTEQKLKQTIRQQANHSARQVQRMSDNGKKQDPYKITTAWWDLKRTADTLEVPVSTVIFVTEQLRTNSRKKVCDQIKYNKDKEKYLAGIKFDKRGIDNVFDKIIDKTKEVEPILIEIETTFLWFFKRKIILNVGNTQTGAGVILQTKNPATNATLKNSNKIKFNTMQWSYWKEKFEQRKRILGY